MWGHPFYYGNNHVVSWVSPHIQRPQIFRCLRPGPHLFPCSSKPWTTVFCIAPSSMSNNTVIFIDSLISEHIFVPRKIYTYLEGRYVCVIHLFKASALWADAFYKSKCPSVCVSVCPFVCSLLRYRLNVFLPPLPKVGYPIFLEIRNPWRKVMERSGLRFKHFCSKVV